MVKKFALLCLCVSFLSWGSYREGYEDGGAKRDKISFASDEYIKGYDEGKKDVYFDEQGRSDAAAGYAPNSAMEHHAMYRKGYRDAGRIVVLITHNHIEVI